MRYRIIEKCVRGESRYFIEQEEVHHFFNPKGSWVKLYDRDHVCPSVFLTIDDARMYIKALSREHNYTKVVEHIDT